MLIMFAVIACLAGVLGILLIAEQLWRLKVLKGEHHRKFVHIVAGSFIAFWPWLISWRAIQIIAAGMLVVVLVNRQRQHFHFLGIKPRNGFGDLFFALAILLCALITTNQVFFALAILHLALADGLASVIGTKFGQKWRYHVFHQTKTIVGSMAFWFISLSILGVGVLFAHDIISFQHYAILLLALPPILTLLENVTAMGLDNVVVPLAVLTALDIAVS
jgi:dolichol kinase